MPKLITKSDYVLWRECPHSSWMKKWKPEIYHSHPLSEFELHLISTGNMVEEKAHERFPDGVTIERRDEKSVEETKKLLKSGTETIYQAAFSDGTLFAAVDILKQGENGLSLYEVKASNSSKMGGDSAEEEDDAETINLADPKELEKYEKKLLKDPHLYDLAFQVYLTRKLGHKVEKAFLVRLNKGYVRGEILDIKKLFIVDDVTKYVDQIMPEVEKGIGMAVSLFGTDKEPAGPCGCISKGRSRHCTTFAEHNKEVPAYGVHDLTRIGNSPKKLHELIDSHVYDIMKVPDGMFDKKIGKQVRVHKSGQAEIDRVAIKEELDTLQFPLYFLDYESFNPAIPRFIGYKPYQHIPFQFSLHRLDKAGGELVEMDGFLYTGKEDPAPMFLQALKKQIGKSGSVIVWYKPFEESHINKHLAIRHPEYSDLIANISSRFFDIMTIYSKQLHIHPDFHGSASIKKVLPVVCPELSYKELEIGNGSEAMNIWNKIVTEDVGDAEKEEIEKNMREYCGLDTYAMFAIWKYLNEEVS